MLRDVKFLEEMPQMFRGDKSLETYFSAAETANFSKEEREQYDKDMITKTDIKYALEYSHKTGVEEGKAEGKTEAIMDTARKMKADRLQIEVICRYTGLTAEQVEAL